MITAEKTFDVYAPDYDAKFNENPLGVYQRERIHAEITPYLNSRSRLLDIGCGPGSDFAFYKSLNLQVDAIDISSRMVELASIRAAQIHLDAQVICSDLMAYQPQDTYDAIILNFGVINTFPELPPVLNKLKQLLREDRVVIIVSMPPVHAFSLLGDIVSGRLSAAWQRIVHQRITIGNGLLVNYYRRRDFATHFKILKKFNLATLLPTPDQYQQQGWARHWGRLFMPLDQRLSISFPDALGGDHIGYILAKK